MPSKCMTRVAAAAALMAACHGLAVAAQASQANVQLARKNAPVSRSMPTPGIDIPAQLKRIRFNPVELITMGHRLLGAVRDEGDVTFEFDGERLVQEEIGTNGQIRGDYKYDRHGRFERIDYTDGASIVAKYGDNNEMVSLTSNTGRSIGFTYERAEGGAAVVVSPTEHPRQFHAVVALLRMQKMPSWLQPPAQPYFQGKEPMILDIPTVWVPGKADGSPIDFIPIGGYGPSGRGGSSGDPGAGGAVREAGEAAALADCLASTILHFQWALKQCDSAPTLPDRGGCVELAFWVREHRIIGCNTGDYHHLWVNNYPPIDYTPWKRKGTRRKEDIPG